MKPSTSFLINFHNGFSIYLTGNVSPLSQHNLSRASNNNDISYLHQTISNWVPEFQWRSELHNELSGRDPAAQLLTNNNQDFRLFCYLDLFRKVSSCNQTAVHYILWLIAECTQPIALVMCRVHAAHTHQNNNLSEVHSPVEKN